MKKFYRFLLVASLLLAVLCIGAFAADTVIYVNGNTGTDTNTGAANSPIKSIEVAFSKFDGTEGGTLVICTPITVAPETELSSSASGPILVTTYYRVNYANISKAQLNIEGNLYLDAPVTFDKIKLNYLSDNPMLFCQGNDVTFGAEIENIYPSTAPAIYTGTHGAKEGISAKKAEYFDYTVNVLGGTWYYIKGGSYRNDDGQIVGTVGDFEINISGGTFTAKGNNDSSTALTALVGFDALRGDAALNISGGTFASAIVGIGRSGYNSTVSNQQYADGNVSINISGGTFNGGEIRAVQDGVVSEINGDFTVSVSGGTFSNFGGVDASGVNGLATAEIASALGLKTTGFDPTLTVASGDAVTVTGDALIRVSGVVPVSALKISGNGKVIIEGADEDAKITIGDVWYVGTNTIIRNIAIDGYGTGVISCSDGKILIDDGITGNGFALKNFTDATVRSGLFAYIKGARDKDVRLHIDGATISGDVVAVANETDKSGYVLITSGKVGGSVYAFEYSGNEGAIHLLGGEVGGKIGVSKNPTDKCVYAFGAVAPEGTTIDYTGCEKYNAPTNAVFVSAELGFAKDQVAGDGSSPLTPMTDLNEAILAAEGRQIVVCGPIYLTSTTNLAKVDGKTVITSKYMGIDYRDFADARIELSDGLRSSGETVYENVTFLAFERYTFVSAESNKLTIGDGVKCELYPGKRIELYPSLVGGTHAKTLRLTSTDLTVKSGTWGVVSGGSHYHYDSDIKTYTINGDINLSILGGTFTEGVYLAGRSVVNGNMNLTVTGGVFDCSVYGSYDGENVSGNIKIELDGGKYHGDIGRTRINLDGATVGSSFLLNIVDGDYDRISSVKLDGGDLNVSEKIDLNATISGSASFTNPIAGYADPSVIYRDGWYYYSFAKDYLGLPAVWIAKASNIYDLGNVEPTLVWAQALSSAGSDIVSLWAPQLYYFDGNWYLYTTCDIGLATSGSARRMPIVWKANTSDPVGTYTYHGLLGNLDTEVYSYLSPRFIEMEGKRFMICGGFWRVEDCTGQHIQRMFICEMSDPLTMGSKMSVISSPQYGFEGGIMEGPFPVVSPKGTLYVLYAAGHTRTDTYCTGILKFTGTKASQLANASYWTKYSEPLHEVNYDANVLSPGAMVITTTPSGDKYLGIYHAKEYHLSAYTMRRLYVQELTFVNDFPTMDAPKETSHVFTLEKNGTPLKDRIFGYATLGAVTEKNREPVYGETTFMSNLMQGDTNFDGIINLIDVLKTMKFTVGISMSGFDYVHSDMNVDNNIDVVDILMILNEALCYTAPVEEPEIPEEDVVETE